ncbi:MAG TPA: superoxide dismutase family protein [Bacteroidia bacterium]|nr:superoxide dismutase family protein [Bacteroidia bacterium]
MLKQKNSRTIIGVTLLFLAVIAFSSVLLYSCKKKDNSTTNNIAPVAKAGPDLTSYPTATVTIDGSGSSDADGSISTYAWTQTSGAACTLTNANTSKLTVSGLKVGSYTFKLTVTDLFGASTSDEMTLNVSDIEKSALGIISQVYNDTVISGTAAFKQKNNEDVFLTLDITCPYKANKSVAVHIHMMPDCGGMAMNAKGHWNPTGSPHGQWGGSPGTFHIGDIGNIPLDATGHGTYTLSTNLWNINGADTSRNVMHRSIMVHSGIDTYSIQPSGNSGNRIGCGEIK